MKNALTQAALDAELTLSDGTPVRLAMPGPSAPKRRALWPWVVVAMLAGYGGWFSQQPWLFVDGPNLVADTPSGLDQVLCQRMIQDLQPSLDATSGWLPALDDVRRKSRCLNDRLRLETLTAQALIFAGLPVERLHLDAIQTADGWQLQSRLGSLTRSQALEPGEALQLIEPLRQVSLDVLDPLIAAQRHLLRAEPQLALAALATREGAAAELTRARALFELGQLDEAWMLYERHAAVSALAQLGLANIAWHNQQPQLAQQLLLDAQQAEPGLRIKLALQMGQWQWAADWLAQQPHDQWLSLRAWLYHERGQFERVIQSYAQLPSSQLTDVDRLRWAQAFEATGQYPRASQLLADLPADMAAYELAKLEFHRGELEAAFAQLEALNTPKSKQTLIPWLIWDDQIARAEVHLNQLPPSDARQALSSQWYLAKQQFASAQQAAQNIQAPVLRHWHLALVAEARDDIAQMRTHFEALSQWDSDRANWLGAQLNLRGGHDQAAAESLKNIGAASDILLYQAQLQYPDTQGLLSPGQRRLFRLAQARVQHHMSLGEYPAAAEHAAQYLQTRDNDPRMAQWLALSYQAMGLQQAALDAYRQAYTGDEMTLALARQAAQLAEQLHRPGQIIEFLEPYAGDLAGEDLNRLLSAWVAQGEYDTAEQWIRTALVKSPNHPTLFVRWGQLLEGMGDLTGALSKYRQAVQLAPNAPEPRLYLASALSARGELNRATEQAQQAMQQPLNAKLAMLAADVFELAGMTVQAAQALDTLPASARTDELKLRLGRLQVDQGLNHSADQTFASVMNEQIQDAGLWRSWGDALAALGQTNEALEKYKTAVRLTRQTSQNQTR
ncbi:MAG: hypothetical protein ACPGU3_00960 [Litorivicinus sp.]